MWIVISPMSPPMSWWSGDLQTCGKMAMKGATLCGMDVNQFPISLLGRLKVVNAQWINQISLKRYSPAFTLMGEAALRVGGLFLLISPSTFDGYFSTPIITFSISQHWQALTSARIQMKCNTFDQETHTVAKITAEKLGQVKEEERGVPISNKTVRALKRHVYATAAWVLDTDQS